jgi:hypothetical protein
MSPSELRPLGELVLDRLRAQAAQYGVDLPSVHWDGARFAYERDPSTGRDALVARWVKGPRNLQVTLRPDGHVHAEFDLLIDHPARPGYWMDVLTLWGQPPALRCEPSLIKKPS